MISLLKFTIYSGQRPLVCTDIANNNLRMCKNQKYVSPVVQSNVPVQ